MRELRSQEVTPGQRLHEVQKALAVDSRLAGLLVEVAKDFADAALRKLYTTNDAAILLRQAGLAEGAEQFARNITKAPTAAHDDRQD